MLSEAKGKEFFPLTSKNMLACQSQISLDEQHTHETEQCLCLKGKNRGATYDSDEKVFRVSDRILLKVSKQRYQLAEYHFSLPGEHRINGEIYPAELHYVFYELDPHDKEGKDPQILPSGNKLTISRVIEHGKKVIELNKLQVHLPGDYFEYDDTEPAAGSGKWIVGKSPMHLNEHELIEVSKAPQALKPVRNFEEHHQYHYQHQH